MYYLITFATKYSRRSYKDYLPVVLQNEQRNIVRTAIVDVAEKNDFKVISLAVLPDHVHVILKAELNTIPNVVSKIKGYSAYKLNHIENLSGRQMHIWARGYHFRKISDNIILEKAIKYVQFNHLKQSVRWGDIDYVGLIN